MAIAQQPQAVNQKLWSVAFVPQIKAGRAEGPQVAEYLNQMIGEWERTGWRFSHLESVTTVRHNGCIAGLFGNPFTTVMCQVAILEKIGA